jgi:glycosyltransferase involved in cell wall biosynthesis
MFIAVHRSAKIIVPAHYWQDVISRTYSVHPSKISVTYEGASEQFLKTPSIHSNKQPPIPYVIYTGNLYPHKNVSTLITAVDIINSENKLKRPLYLAIVCARSVFADKLPKSPWVKYLGRVTDAELASLYHHSSAFVFPSLIEGFGLPGLEAMSVGTPVIAAYATCLPEVYGNAALYFEPTNPTDLADKITLLLHDHKLHQELSSKGKLQAQKYSWEKMSSATWNIYQSLLGR